MPDDQVVNTPAQPTQEQISEALQKSAWGMTGNDQPVNGDEPVVQQQNSPAANATQQKVDDIKEEIVDYSEMLKRDFDIEDVEVLKKERAEYKKLKETPPTPEEIKFANDQSKQIHELLREGKRKEVKEFLDTQDKLETYAAVNVDKDSAENILKLSIGLKNKTLSKDEIEFQYKQEFVAPKEPIQRATETDDDFAERMDEWKEKSDQVVMKRIIAAKIAQPELEKLKSELILPEISKKEATPKQEPTQEDLEKEKQYRETFLKNAENSVKNLMELSTSVKDKDVDLSISYGVSTEQKTAISQKIATFVESGFNANALFAHRWVNADMTLNTDQMTKDLLFLDNQSDILQKNAVEAANQHLEAYIKSKKNINLNLDGKGADFSPNGDKTHSQKLQEHFWGVN